ncbi:Serogroup A1 [Variovorax sp. PBS-H4]|uniref:type IV pilin protein n=1 Tax=Variovorax sp. PBS-H4 TaxID=434008 RepID=UPI001317451F|nr:type IV pilin protein [Variovorax sp. PBS-H4]VTU33716.1 Serogroup A1 [Variovorax sp. PBS-H4]
MITSIDQAPRRHRGFTLIEVMIVVAIVAILAAIAYPSYLESVRKSKRAEARAQLMEVAQYMQRFYSQNDSFLKVLNDSTNPDMTLPDALTSVPRGGAAATYTIQFVTHTASAFNLEAVPTGSMMGDRCGKLRLDSTGLRSVADQQAGLTPSDCWR